MNSQSKFDVFFRAFLTAALFTGTTEDEKPMDSLFNTDDFSDEATEVLRAHALSFFSRASCYMRAEDAPKDYEHLPELSTDRALEAGQDFWLTSQGHGAGFWDGGWTTYGELLTKLSKCYPEEINLHDHEGKIHI